MAGAEGRDVIHRSPDNPLLTLRDMPFQCSDIHNAAVVRHNAGFWFLITVESLEGQYALYLGRSVDGRRIQVDEQPFIRPARDETFAEYESLGVRDPRITALDGTYYITYVAEGDHGHRIGDLPNLVFSCGALVEKDNTLSLYYAGSDSCLCLGMAPIDAIVRTCCEKSEVF